MANVTVNIPLQKSAQVYEDTPLYGFHSNNWYTTYLNPPSGKGEKTLFKFGPVPDAYKYKKIVSAQVNVYAKISRSGLRPFIWLKRSPDGWTDFNESTVNWNNTPAFDRWWSINNPSFPSGVTEAQLAITATTPNEALKLITNVAWLYPVLTTAESTDNIRFYVNTDHPASLSVVFDDAVNVTSKVVASTMTSGYANPYVANTFKWSFTKDGANEAIGPWEQASATFYWRSTGASTWNSVSAGTASQVTIAANTFPVGSIEWYVSGTDTLGTTTQTSVYTLNTTAAQSVATPVSPIDTLVDSSDDVTFSWSVSNANNPTQTGADIQYSADGGSTWTMLAQPTGNVRSVTVAAGSMPGGSLQWRVRSYNIDGSAGDWSSPVSFYYIGAPAAPVVTATAVPFTTVTWTAAGQQVFEVVIDGISQGIKYGTAKIFSVAEPLIDGPHTIQVRIQGIYGLWSDPGSVTINVTNVPGDAITLTGAFDIDALLNWATAGTVTPFYVYRDDVRIGRTPGTSFRDRFVLGEHSYFVLVDLGDGNYTKSNVVSGAMSVSMSYIAAAVNGDWLPLRLSENSVSSQSFTFNRSHSLRHVTAADYPVCEIAQFRDLSGSYDVAFKDAAEAAVLEALFGQIVVVKSRGGSVVIGPLVTLKKLHTDFYLTYSFTVQQIAWEDFVDDQNTGI